MGRRSASRGCVATGNQGARCSRRPRPLELPLNPLECALFDPDSDSCPLVVIVEREMPWPAPVHHVGEVEHCRLAAVDHRADFVKTRKSDLRTIAKPSGLLRKKARNQAG